MKKMNRILALLLALTMMLALTACGGKGGDGGSKDSAPATTAVSGDEVKAEIPSGWCMVTSTEMFGSTGADIISHSEKYESGDAYLQAEEYAGSIEDEKAILESGSPYGTYIGEKELANGTWYLAENAGTVKLGDKVLLVKGYKCDFGSEEVQSILGSLQWVE